MKQTRFIILLLASVFMTNCKQDDFSDSSSNAASENYKLESKTMKELKSDSRFQNSISPFLKKSAERNVNSKSIIEDVNKFEIDSTEAKVITADKYVSYTFAVLEEFVKDDSFKNILFEYNDTDVIPKVSVIRYKVDLSNQKAIIDEIYKVDFQTGARMNYKEECWSITFELSSNCPHVGNHPAGTIVGCAGGWSINLVVIEVCQPISSSSPEYQPGGASYGSYFPAPGSSGTPVSGGGGGPAAIPATSPVYANTLAYNRRKLISKLTLDQRDYYLQSSEETEGGVLAFLTQHSYSDDAFEMVVMVIKEAHSQNTDISALLPVINSFTADKLCQGKKIVSELFNSLSPFRTMLRDDLLRSDDIAIQVGNIPLATGVAAVTGQEIVMGSASPVIQIGFNNSYLGTSTDLGLIVLSQHELLHAYFINLYRKGELLSRYPTYTSLNTAFTNYYTYPLNNDYNIILGEIMHNVYIDFIDAMAQDIYQYGQVNNIIGLTLQDSKNLVWGALDGTALFNSDALTINERYNAKTAIEKEILNQDGKKGTKTCP